MKTIPIFPTLSLMASACCVIAQDAGGRLVMMPIDEVRVPGAARAGAPVEASFVGFLTNGCQRFERLEVTETEDSAMVVMWARERRPPGTVCTADIREVERAHPLRPPRPGRFVVTVKQPDGAVATREIRVE